MTTTRPPDWASKMWRECYPVGIMEDRYGGCYTGGAWIALANDSPERRAYLSPLWGSDTDAGSFDLPVWAAVGDSPNDAATNLYRKVGLTLYPEYADT